MNTLVFLHGSGSHVHGGMARYTDVPSIVSPNTKILFLQADERFYSKKQTPNIPLWFDVYSDMKEGKYDENAFNKEDAIASAHKIIEVINQEVNDYLDGNYERLWIGG